MIMKIIAEFGAWTWWIVGFSFLILEIAAPGVFFLWVGLAALLVGTLALLITMSWQAQIIAFAILALVFAVLGRQINARFGNRSENQTLNERGKQYVGQKYILHEGLVNGQGRVKIGDSIWLVRGPDELSAGATVKVTGVDGTILIVEADRV